MDGSGKVDDDGAAAAAASLSLSVTPNCFPSDPQDLNKRWGGSSMVGAIVHDSIATAIGGKYAGAWRVSELQIHPCVAG